MECIVREIEKSELPILEDFLYEAIFQRDSGNLVPRNIIKQPEISVFIDDFGKKDDNCLVAEIEGNIIGVVWSRILAGKIKGFGNIDDKTPELAISLLSKFRGKQIGTKLVKSMLQLLKNKGYKQTSLAVQKDNYAVKMYEKVGFRIIKELEEEFLMLCILE